MVGILPEYIHFLLNGQVYPHPVASTELIQTHISYVILAGDYVYKWKKPVDLGFLDFTQLAQRQYYCDQEVRLNRRLCPEVYLGTVKLTRDGERFTLGGEGETVEHGVVMKRLPCDRMMDRVMVQAGLSKEQIKQIVDVLIPFYAEAKCEEATDFYGDRDSVASLIHANFEETRRFIGGGTIPEPLFRSIERKAEAFLKREDLFQKRIESGHVRECHGDLHSGNICLANPVAIFDCIEFNESLRYMDIAADIAFLAMDLEYHGMSRESDYFINSYVEGSGDAELLEMLDFYKAYRAYVRGKIGLLTAMDKGVPTSVRRSQLSRAKKYFELSEKCGSRW